MNVWSTSGSVPVYIDAQDRCSLFTHPTTLTGDSTIKLVVNMLLSEWSEIMGMNAWYNMWGKTLIEMLSIWGLIKEKNILAEYKEGYQLLIGGETPLCSELDSLHWFLWWRLCCQYPSRRLLWLALFSLNEIFQNGTKEKNEEGKFWSVLSSWGNSKVRQKKYESHHCYFLRLALFIYLFTHSFIHFLWPFISHLSGLRAWYF